MAVSLEAWQAEVGAALVARTQQAATTFRLLSRAMDVLTHLLPGDADLAALTSIRQAAEHHFINAASHEPTQPAFEASVAKAEERCSELEKRLIALDGEVPMDWFKERFDPRMLTPESIVDYAAALGRHLKDLPQRLDRIEFVLTRMVAVALPEGGSAPARDLEVLFRDAFPPATIEASTRQAAVGFFSQAAARVKGFASFKELFDSGLFVDVRGYKLSLRSHLLDPDIIAAAIDANRAITAQVQALIAADSPTEKEVAQHFAEVDAQIRKVFHTLRADETELKKRFAVRLQKLQLGSNKPARTFEQFQAQRSAKATLKPATRRRLVLGVLILLAGLALVRQTTRSTRMAELTPSEVQAVSAVLESAAVSRDGSRMLMGRVSKARWTLLGPAQRRQTAEAVAQALKLQDLRSATLLLDDRVVVQVEDGKVLLVE